MTKKLDITRGRGIFGLGFSLLLVSASLGIAGAGHEAPVADAVERGDKQAAASLIKSGADVNAVQSDGATALHWAAYLNDAETTALLLRAGAKVDARNDLGVTPLALAAQQGGAAVIEQLLKAGAKPNDPVNFVDAGETPLMHAARSGSVDAVKVLAKAGADLNAKENWNGQTALMWAAAEGHATVIETLIEFGADIKARSNAGTTPFMFAVRKGNMASVKAMLAAGADVNEKRTDLATPLLVAIINGYEDIAELLLDKGADPNAEGGSTELTIQGMRAKPQKIVLKTPTFREQLRDVGSEGGNGKNNTFGKPLQAAVHVANWHISDEFISANVDRLRLIKALVAHGADVNGRNTDMEPRWSGARYRHRLVGATAFLFAAKAADVEAMRLLLKLGADPNINTGVNITPLMAAAGIAWASNQERASEEQVLEAVKLLVEECGADVNFVADTGETAMHAAAYRGANSVVQYLFDKGAKLDVVDKSGRTPLTIAEGVEYGNSFAAQPQTAELLRKLGAKEIPCPNLCPNLIPEDKLPPEEAKK
ncbi:MAG TPA: ankyrin repeat domain-containing protein [Bryobacteraceae bacterium]|jgi:ankyrin repeat protein|nr:ankyrin repeat domain-containing protein [Bryobacteraceae bacterium]